MNTFKKLLSALCFVAVFCAPGAAYADNIVDALNLAPFVPMILDALMMVATGGYEFFVGNGIIYGLIVLFLVITITIGLLKMFAPKEVLSFLNISGGGEIAEGKATPMDIATKVLKPGFRAFIAVVFLLQMSPVFLTKWLVNPFLHLGSVYTHQITQTINETGTGAPKIECPTDITEKAWLNPESCEFLVQPVSDLSHANNQIITRGFKFLTDGLRGLLTMIPHGGEDFMNVLTGILLIITFVGSNLFMAMLVIQGIFNFGIQLILYPFYVLTYVTKSSDKWFDVWPAFSGITKALQQLIITMIACAFILCINLAVIKALFHWNSSVFVSATGGSAYSNLPTPEAVNAIGFGNHSVTWMSAILTFYLMYKIYQMTQKQLETYIGGGMDKLYKQVGGDVSTMWKGIKKTTGAFNDAVGWFKKK
ncbi:MAG: hypothetical protein IKB10_02085 [Alphaproteobacteria bacterium]|nr:hypothetical protein [Alphaproteobacteria bacterium]